MRELLVNGRVRIDAVDAMEALARKLGDDAGALRWRKVRGDVVRRALGVDFR